MPTKNEIWSILHELRHSICNPGQLEKNVSKLSVVYLLLEHLENDSEDIQCECLLLLSAVMPKLGTEMESLLNHQLPQISKCLGHKDLQIKLASINFIYAYSKHAVDLDKFFKEFINLTFETSDQQILNGGLLCATMLLKLVLKKDSYIYLMDSVCCLLKCCSSNLLYNVFYLLKHIKALIGDDEFFYTTLELKEHDIYLYFKDLECRNEATEHNFPLGYNVLEEIFKQKTSAKDGMSHWKSFRAIRSQIQDISWETTDLMPHIEHLVNVLNRFLNNSSPKVQIFCLDIFEIVIERMHCNILIHLTVMVESLLKIVTCSDKKVKKRGAYLLHRLMHFVHPMMVIQELLDHAHCQNSTVRREIINRVTAALFHCALYSFDFKHLCFSVLPFLEDSVLQVRQSAVECLVLIGHVMLSTGQASDLFEEYMKELGHVNNINSKLILSRVRKGLLPGCTTEGHVSAANCQPPDSDSSMFTDDSCLPSRVSTMESNQISCASIFAGLKSVSNKVLRGNLDTKLRNEGSFCNDASECKNDSNIDLRKAKEEVMQHLDNHNVSDVSECPSAQHDGEKYVCGQNSCENICDTEIILTQNSTQMGGSQNYVQRATEKSVDAEIPFNSDLNSQYISEADSESNHELHNPKSVLEVDGSPIYAAYEEDDDDMNNCGQFSLHSDQDIYDDSLSANISDVSHFSFEEEEEIMPDVEHYESRKQCKKLSLCSKKKHTSPEKNCKSPSVTEFRPLPYMSNFNVLTLDGVAKMDNVEELSDVSKTTTPDNMLVSMPMSDLDVYTPANVQYNIQEVRQTNTDDDDRNEHSVGLNRLTEAKPSSKKSNANIPMKSEDNSDKRRHVRNRGRSKTCENVVKDKKASKASGLNEDKSNKSKLNNSFDCTSPSLGKDGYQSEDSSNLTRKLLKDVVESLQISSRLKDKLKNDAVVSKCGRENAVTPSNQGHLKYKFKKQFNSEDGAHNKYSKELVDWFKNSKKTETPMISSQMIEILFSQSLKILEKQSSKDECNDKGSEYSLCSIDDKESSCSKLTTSKCSPRSKEIIASKELPSQAVKKKVNLISEKSAKLSKPRTSNSNESGDAKKTLSKNSLDCHSQAKLVPERRASEQWSLVLGLPLRCQERNWAEFFEKKVKHLSRMHKTDVGAILKQACESFELKISKKEASPAEKEEYFKLKEEAMLSVIGVAKHQTKYFDESTFTKVIDYLLVEAKSPKLSMAGKSDLTIGYLYMYKPLDLKLKIVISMLLGKSGSRRFAGTYNMVMRSIFYIFKGVSPYKLALILIAEGSKHTNKAVRETAAQFLFLITERLGAKRCLNSSLVSPMLNAAAEFAMDGSPLSRHCGKLMLSIFMAYEDFEALKKKHVISKDLLNLTKVLKTLEKKGVEMDELIPIQVVLRTIDI